MVACSVAGCKKVVVDPLRKIRYFSFPKDENLCKQWVAACGKSKPFKLECARICSKHFLPRDYRLRDRLLKAPENKMLLENGAIPTQNLPFKTTITKKEKMLQMEQNKILVEECIAAYERNKREKALKEMHMADRVPPIKKEIVDEHSYTGGKNPSRSSQTEIDFGCAKEMHIMRLEAELRKMRVVINRHVKRLQEFDALKSSLSKLMTTGQLNRLMHPGKKLKWVAEDIASAMPLQLAGPMAYELLRKRKFPLPSSSTLRGWAGKIEIKPGILNSVLENLSQMQVLENDRLCVLSFRKLKLKASTYKSHKPEALKARFACVVTVRGLIKDWAQVVYFDLDNLLTAEILNSIILKLEEINFTVVAAVSDMRIGIERLWDKLGVSESTPFFFTSFGRKVFFLADALHILKLIRNIFIDDALILNGSPIGTQPLRDLLDMDEPGLKITSSHLDVSGLERRYTKLATELISESVSAVVERCVNEGKLQSEAFDCALFLKAIHYWFELFNSKENATEKQLPYGLDLEGQNTILSLVSENMQELSSTKKKSALRFRNGIILNNSCLVQLLEHLKAEYGITHIFTERLNHGEFERMLCAIRSKTGTMCQPTPLEFKYRIRSYILSKMKV